MARKSKCIICRNSTEVKYLKLKTTQNRSKYVSNIFDAWKRECSEAICDLLLGGKSDALLHYFQNAEFCYSCLQIVRDIGFMWKQIQYFQSRIKKLSTDIRKHLNSNYQQIEEKSNPNVIHKRVSVFLEAENVRKKIPHYSYEDMVEIIYTAILRHQLQPQQMNDLSPEEMEKQLNIQNQVITVTAPTKLEFVKVEVEENLDFEDNDCGIDHQSNGNISDHQSNGNISDHQSNDNISDHQSNDNISDYQSNDNISDHQSNYSSSDDFKTTESGLKRSSTRRRKKNVKYKDYDEDGTSSEVSDSSSITSFKRQTRHSKTIKSRNMKSVPKSTVEKVEEKMFQESEPNSEKNGKTRVYCPEETCQASFTTEQKMEIHVLKFHKGERKPYHCTKCEKKFSTKRSLTKHSASHASERERGITIKYPCSFCGKRYLQEEDLTTHYSESHQEPNPFTCAFCPEIYSNCVDLKQHTKEFHRDPYKKPRSACDVCGKSFSNKYTLKYHMKMHGDQSLLFSCPICEMKFALKTWLNVHMDQKHTDGKQYKCDKCDKSFPHSSSLKKHKIHHHNENGYPCTICGVMLTSLGRWERHEQSHKNLIVSQIKRSKKGVRYLHVCKFCGKGYNEEEEINAHYSVAHLGPNPFTCAFCSNFYSNSTDLQQHMKSNHPDPIAEPKKYACDSCDRVFTTRDGLKTHSIIHKDPRLLFRCHLCPGTFIHNSYLRKHIRRHSEEKKCICETCGKGFKDMDYLKTHMNIHLERKFKCSLCEKSFVKAYQCKMHEVTHTGIKEFVCQVCGKAFNKRGNMNAHFKLMHSDEPPPKRRPNLKQSSDEQQQLQEEINFIEQPHFPQF